MTVYKNINTGKFAEFGGIPDNSWVKATQKEAQNSKIEDLKFKKIREIKAIRDQQNIEPISDCKAFVISKTGKKTTKNSYFLFHTNRHQTNPSSDPDSIISRVMNLGSMPYFTKDVKGNKITVELTPEIVKILHQKITERNDTNLRRRNEIEAAIKKAKTVEEIEAIE